MMNETSRVIGNASASVKDMAKDYFVYKLAINVHIYWLSTLIVAGIAGNIISLIVMLQVRNI